MHAPLLTRPAAARRHGASRRGLAFLATLLAAILAALLTVGCGGGGGGGGGTPAGPTLSPITITTAPVSQTVSDGQTARLGVVAASALPLAYQWQRNGLSIAGATEAAYVTPPLAMADNGVRYAVVLANASGATQSAVVTLTVQAAAVPVLEPLLQVAVVAPGQTVLITTTVASALPYRYQWLRNGLPIAGAAGDSSDAQVNYRTAPQTVADHGARYALEVGNAQGTAQSTPTTLSVAGPPRVAAGGAHTLARSTDGRAVWAWGDNAQGQLGAAAVAGSTLPLRVAGLPRITAVAAGATHSLALAEDGGVWAWGGNAAGALGDGTRADRATPQRVAGVEGAVGIAAGNGRSFAVRGDGSVLGWGDNAGGALGLGTRTDALRPARVGAGIVGFENIVAVASGTQHTLALRADGQVFHFGAVAVPLPDGATVQTSPVLLAGLSTIAAIGAGPGHSLALDIASRLWAWGLNGSGQLGVGSTTAAAAPARVALAQSGEALLPSLALAVGDGYALALPLAGPLLSWGAADTGQLGGVPIPSPALRPAALAALPGALAAVAAGRGHAVAVLADGSVYSWGANAAGQLGIGAPDLLRATPALVPGLNLDAVPTGGP